MVGSWLQAVAKLAYNIIFYILTQGTLESLNHIPCNIFLTTKKKTSIWIRMFLNQLNFVVILAYLLRKLLNNLSKDHIKILKSKHYVGNEKFIHWKITSVILIVNETKTGLYPSSPIDLTKFSTLYDDKAFENFTPRRQRFSITTNEGHMYRKIIS